MDNQHCITEHKKWQHITDEERYYIQFALKEGNKQYLEKAGFLEFVVDKVRNAGWS